VDVAATLELRGYALGAPRASRARGKASRYDGRFYLVGVAVLAAGVAGRFLGADSFDAYPTLEIGSGSATLGLSLLLLISGFAPLRRKQRRRVAAPLAPEASRA
jgi:hypothetical protein